MKITTLEQVKNEEFDFVVIGAGSAGAAIAARLAEDPAVKVCLVEAGKDPRMNMDAIVPLACGNLQRSELDWQFVSESSEEACQGMVESKNLWPRGFCLGGCSVLNYMAAVRGAKTDFDRWQNVFGMEGWGWDSVLPFFKKLETVQVDPSREDVVMEPKAHGTVGPVSISVANDPNPIAKGFVKAATNLGFRNGDYNSGEMNRVVSLMQQTIHKGRRCDTCFAYLDAVEEKPNLTILIDSQATRLLLDETKSKVIGAEFANQRKKGGPKIPIFASKEVILSAGAIGSPHVLLLSGIGPEESLQGHVECSIPTPPIEMEDHIATTLRFNCKPGFSGSVNTRRAESINTLPNLTRWALFGTSVLSTSAYDATLFYHSKERSPMSTSLGPDIQIGIFCAPGNAKIFEENLNLDPNYLKGSYESPTQEGLIFVPTLLHPHSRGSLKLKSQDPFEQLEITHNYFSDPRDVDAAVESYKKCMEMASTPGLSEICGEPVLPPHLLERHKGELSDDFWSDFARGYGGTLYHPVGTCSKMVDGRLRFKLGLSNLRIADASIMPEIVSANTNLACIMIGEKCASMIKEEYSLSSANETKRVDKGPSMIQAVGALAALSAGALFLTRSKL